MRARMLRSPFRSTTTAVAVVTVALLGPPARVSRRRDSTPTQILSAFNAERTANGLPAITEVPDWSRSCVLHNHYQAATGSSVTSRIQLARRIPRTAHGQVLTPSLPLRAAGLLANPWLNAPIHLNQMMSPSLVQAGFAESENYNCFTTFAGYSDTSPWRRSTEPDRIWSFPGQGQTMPYAQTANEAPHTPGEWVGIPQGTRTGPYLLVDGSGPPLDPNPNDSTFDPNTRVETNPTPSVAPLSLLTAATVSALDGPVDLRVRNTATHQGDGYFVAPDSGFVLPIRPLRPNTTYTVSVTFATSPDSLQPARSHSGAFTFRTNRTAYTAKTVRRTVRVASTSCHSSGARTRTQRMRLRTLRSRSGSVTVRLALAFPASVAVTTTARSRVLVTQRAARALPAGVIVDTLSSFSLSKLRAALGRRRSITVSS